MVVFIIVLFVMIVFVIVHCDNMHNIAQMVLQLLRLLFPRQLLLKTVVLKTSDSFHYFRVKNG